MIFLPLLWDKTKFTKEKSFNKRVTWTAVIGCMIPCLMGDGGYLDVTLHVPLCKPSK